MDEPVYALPKQASKIAVISGFEVYGASTEAAQSPILLAYLDAAKKSIRDVAINVFYFAPDQQSLVLQLFVDSFAQKGLNDAAIKPLTLCLCKKIEPLQKMRTDPSQPIHSGRGYFSLAL